MKRPFINLDKHNLLYNIGVGTGWFVTGLLGLIDYIKPVNYFIAFVDVVLVAILLYTAIGKIEKNDEMTFSYFEKARSFGFHAATCACMILISINIIFDGCVPFKVGAPVILGIAYMTTGWVFRQLERGND